MTFPACSRNDVVGPRGLQASLAVCVLLRTRQGHGRAYKDRILSPSPVCAQFPGCARPAEPDSSAGRVCHGGKEPVGAASGWDVAVPCQTWQRNEWTGRCCPSSNPAEECVAVPARQGCRWLRSTWWVPRLCSPVPAAIGFLLTPLARPPLILR